MPDPNDAHWAGQLRTQFAALDGHGLAGSPDNKTDGKLTLVELEPAAKDPKHPAHDAAVGLTTAPARFAWFDAGGWAQTPKDSAVTMSDLDSVARMAAVVPVRIEGDAQVYLVLKGSAEPLTQGAASLQDLSLFSFEPAHVKSMSILSGTKALVTVAKDGASWKVIEPKHWTGKSPFDPAQVATRLAEWRRFKALRWDEGAVTEKQAGTNSPSWTARVTLDDGKKQEVRFGKVIGKPADKTPGEQYVKGVDGQIYVTSEKLKDALAPGVERFVKPPPPPPTRPGQGLDSLPADLRRQLENLRAQGGAGL
jgi:hypothetical protein